MAELVKAGKVRYLGLSEASAATIRRAHNFASDRCASDGVFPVDARSGRRDSGYDARAWHRLRGIQSVGTRIPDRADQALRDFAPDDYRRNSPRFQGENFQKNLDLVAGVEAIAKEKACTPGQLALAWLLKQGQDIIPIPGTERRKYLEENAGALNVTLSQRDLQRIDEVAPHGAAAGLRYPEIMMALVGR